jgi:hypothetical protein
MGPGAESLPWIADNVTSIPASADVQRQAVQVDDELPGLGVVVEISDAPATEPGGDGGPA